MNAAFDYILSVLGEGIVGGLHRNLFLRLVYVFCLFFLVSGKNDSEALSHGLSD